MAEQGSVWKYLPGVVGLIIGLMIFNPPSFLHHFGGASYLLMVLFAIFALIAFSAIIISKNLPKDLTIRRSTNTALPGEMTKLSTDYKSLGFVQTSEVPLSIGIAPPAVVIPFVNEQERIYGAIYKTDTIPSRISFDLFSIFEGDRGGLTTGVLAEGGALPVKGSLKQVFLHANVLSIYEKHRQAIAYLKGKGITCKPANPQSFEKEMRSSILRVRRTFLASPVMFTLIVIWRAATKKTPHIGPIQTQEEAQKQIQRIVTGKTNL